VAVRDDDPIDATLEGAPIPDDTGESSEVLWASVEAPAVAVGRGAPPPVTMPDMPPLAAPPTVPKGPAASSPPPRLTAPPTQRAAATVVARLADVIGSDGISFDASEADGEASGFEDGATRPDVARHAPEPAPAPSPTPPPPAPAMRAVPLTPTPAPRIRPAEPPPDFDELKGGPPPSTLPPSTLPPPALPRRETRAPMAGIGLPGQGAADGSLPSPPPSSSSSSSSSPPRRETRGPMAGVSLPGAGVLDPPVPPPSPPRRETRGPVAGVGGALDPPLPPPSSTPKRSETRGPVAGVGGALDPPLPPVAPKTRAPPRRERPVDDAPPVSAAPPATGGGRGVLPIVAAVIVVLVVIVAMTRGGGGSIAGGLNPRDARTLADRARASLAHKARSDVEDPVRGIARSIVGEGARVLVLRDKAGDAWLLPDGGIVVTDGLLRRLSSDAQLAAIIAHLTAHHDLGHIGALSVDLDGPAVLAASAASAGVDEEETDVRAAALLVKAGWRARALVEAEDALGAGPWASRHKRLASKIVAAVGPDASGREDKDWYERQIRSVLGAP
jgi:hypothetical protein